MDTVQIIKSIRIATGKPGTPEQKLERIRGILAQAPQKAASTGGSKRKRKESDTDRMTRGGYDRGE